MGCLPIGSGVTFIALIASISLIPRVTFVSGNGHFISIVEQPLAVNRPIIFPVGILLHADNGCDTILAFFSLCAPFTVLDGYIPTFQKRDYIASSIGKRRYSGDVIFPLEGFNQTLQRENVRVHGFLPFLKGGDTVF